MKCPPPEVLHAKVNGTDITYGDLILIGQYVLNAAAAVEPMRHASPAGLLDYAAPQDAWGRIVLDFIRWCSRGTEDAESSVRLQRLVAETGWATQVFAAAAHP